MTVGAGTEQQVGSTPHHVHTNFSDNILNHSCLIFEPPVKFPDQDSFQCADHNFDISEFIGGGKPMMLGPPPSAYYQLTSAVAQEDVLLHLPVTGGLNPYQLGAGWAVNSFPQSDVCLDFDNDMWDVSLNDGSNQSSEFE